MAWSDHPLGLILLAIPVLGYTGLGVRWVLEKIVGRDLWRG